LLNNQFMTAMANRMGEGIGAGETRMTSDLARLFYRVTGREILGDELSLLVDYSKQHGASNACRVILNLNEFVFVD